MAQGDVEIRRLAEFLTASPKAEPRTLIIGAGASRSSGVPDWTSMCKRIIERLQIPMEQHDAIETVKRYFQGRDPRSRKRALTLGPELGAATEPSMGYRHLANMLANGVFDLVISTNWDALVEKALSQLLPVDQFRVLIRGEVPDDLIAEYLESDDDLIKIVKLHGDLGSRFFLLRDDEISRTSSKLNAALRRRIRNECVIVGQSLQDGDLAQLLVGGDDIGRGSIYYVGPRAPTPGSAASVLLQTHDATIISGDLGRFDEFAATLDLAIAAASSRRTQDRIMAVEHQILERQERGVGYINFAAVQDLVDRLARRIHSKRPDVLLYVDDPRAPGGTEVEKRISHPALKLVPSRTIPVLGDFENRVRGRHAEGGKCSIDGLDPHAAETVVVVDSITMSGHTLSLACEVAARQYPNARIYPAVLVSARSLTTTLKDLGAPLRDLIYILETDRHEICFPWGSTYATADVSREIDAIDGGRSVEILVRPWGTNEVIVDQEVCSVRLLTLEPNSKLSFQRHLCRDELFIALDDEVGMDVSGQEFDGPATDFDPRVQSLMLEKGDYLMVPRGLWHRARAPRSRVRLLEVAFGIYDQVNDVERAHDKYGRADLRGDV